MLWSSANGCLSSWEAEYTSWIPELLGSRIHYFNSCVVQSFFLTWLWMADQKPILL